MALLEKRINNIIKAIVIREVSRKDVRTIIRLADEMAQTIQDALTNDEAIEKHNASEHFTTILPKLGEMASEPLTVDIYTEV